MKLPYDRESDWNEAKGRKSALLERAKKHQRKQQEAKVQGQGVTTSKADKLPNQYEKKVHYQLERKIRQQEADLRQLKRQLKQAKETYKRYKSEVNRERQHYQLELEAHLERHQQLERELKQLQTQAQEAPATQAKASSLEVYQLPAYQYLRKEYMSLLRRHHNLQEQARKQSKKSAKIKEESQWKSAYQDLRAEYQHYKQEQEFQSNEQLLDILLHRAELGHFHAFEALNRLVAEAQGVFDALAESQEERASESYYGYLTCLGDQWFLVTYEAHTAHELMIPDGVRPYLVDEAPAKARLTSQGLILSHVYRHLTTRRKGARIRSSRAHQREGRKENPISSRLPMGILDWLRRQRLLLIGNEVGIKDLVSNLQPLLKALTWLDAYEQSPHRVQKAIHAHDMVIVFTGSIPHSVTDYTHAVGRELTGPIIECYHPKVDSIVSAINRLYWELHTSETLS